MRPTPSDPSNNTTPPECSDCCKYMQKYDGFMLQQNALRSELASMINPMRCGWNIKEGHIGGHPLDYEGCIYIH